MKPFSQGSRLCAANAQRDRRKAAVRSEPTAHLRVATTLRTTRPSETHEAHDANVVSRFVGFLLNTDKILVRHSVQRSAYTVIANYLVVSCDDEKSPTINDTFARGKRHRVRSLAHRRGPGAV